MSRALGTAVPWQGAVRRPRRRSRLLGVLRVLLPLLALVLVGLVLAWPQIMRDSGGIGVPTLVPGDGDQPDRLRMDSPRYVGKTSSDRPYELTARAASLDPLQANVVHLEQPAADIALGEDGDVHLLAASGTYDRDTGRLLLDGGIEVVTSSGYRFVTPSARINLGQGQIRGWQPIEGEGPAGTLSANRFEIQDAGDVLRFDGRVRVTVLPPAGRDAASDEEPATAPSKGGTSS
jgi:lipopolysaccharide export system protein LptC